MGPAEGVPAPAPSVIPETSNECSLMPEGPSPLAPARNLQRLLSERGVFPPAEAVLILRQLLEQVSALHAAGQTHQAILPDRVFLDESGQATLLPSGGQPGDPDPEHWPPELRQAADLRLPTDIAAARRVL